MALAHTTELYQNPLILYFNSQERKFLISFTPSIYIILDDKTNVRVACNYQTIIDPSAMLFIPIPSTPEKGSLLTKQNTRIYIRFILR